ncbi:MAG: GAF domain-containing protein, partial [Planctomycetota bacterium]
MSDQPRIVLLGDAGDASKPDGMQSGDAKTASDLGEALAIAGENAMPSLVTTSLDVGRGWLDALPDGIAVVRNDGSVVWANAAFLENFASAPDVSGRNFFDTLGVERPAANASPFGEGGGRPNRRYPSSDGRHFELHVGPSPGDDGSKLALVHDVTDQVRLQQKREAIHRAGFELGDIRPDELVEMNDGERIELLKSKIEHYVRDLLEFETAEIRLLEESTGRLRSLLAMGMTDTAEGRELVVSEVGNGVTGYVAATGRSYRCSNTRTDPNYIEGAEGALSSLTVPIHFADEFLGTFNVESPAENAFDELDE